MSVQALAWVLERSESRRYDRCVLLAIAKHADASGRDAWPTTETIAHEANCSVRTVFRSILVLRDIGELEWISGAGKAGMRRKSNLYTLPKMTDQVDMSSAEIQPVVTCQSEPSSDDKVSSDPDKVSDPTPQGDTGELRTVLENRPIEPVDENVENDEDEDQEQTSSADADEGPRSSFSSQI